MTKPVRQRWGRVSILITLAVIGTLPNTTASAEERFQVADFQLTGMCEKFAPEYELTSFEIEDDSESLPMIVSRDAGGSEVDVKSVFFKPFFYGMLFSRTEGDKKQSVLHCAFFKTYIDFILIERSERWMIFESGARQATEVHFHSHTGCGTSCIYGRSETIVFFDDPVVPPEEEGWLHSHPMAPLYIHNGDAHPNEHPNRWFRSYLSEEEKILFDKEVAGY